MDAITANGEFEDATRLYRFDNGVEAALPLAARRRPMRGVAGALPTHWGTGGLVTNAPLSPTNAAVVLADIVSLKLARVTIWPDAMQGEAWEQGRRLVASSIISEPRRFHVLDLTPGYAHIHAKGFDKYTRRYLRRADEAGVTTEHDRTGRLVDEFFHILQLAVPRWAEQQHEPVALAKFRAARRDPIEKFRAICTHMGDSACIGIARLEGRPIAAVLYLLGRNADIIWAPVDPDLGPAVHAPTKLYAEAIEAACAHGCPHFSMGESGDAEGLDRFKRRLGARPVDYHSYRIERYPLTPAEDLAKRFVKRAIGFRETANAG